MHDGLNCSDFNIIDLYLCVPRNSPYEFHWLPSSSVNTGPDGFNYGANKSTHCIKLLDPEKPSGTWWNDNYLCAKPASSVEHACVPCSPGLDPAVDVSSNAGSTSSMNCMYSELEQFG